MSVTRASYITLLAVVSLAVTLAVACGPSLRRTYQSDNAFARCFDMDYRPGVADTEKEGCWKTWLSSHVYNQPGDKTRYANLRLDELARGISVPGPPGPIGRFDQRPHLDEDAGVASSDGGLSEESPPAGGKVLVSSDNQDDATCPRKCAFVFETCHSACTTDAGVEKLCDGACTKSRNTCLSLCTR